MPRGFLRDMKEWKLRDSEKDIRGKKLKTPEGQEIGKIRDFFVDTDSREVRGVVLEDGKEYPINDINVRGSDVILAPGATATRQMAAGRTGAYRPEQGEMRIPIIEETIHVGKREVQHGGVRVRTDVVEEPVSEDVKLRRTEVHVERHPVDRPATEADIQASKREAEFVETEEEAVVGKSARVVEEVVIKPETEEKAETVREKVRRTDVKVEKEGEEPKG